MVMQGVLIRSDHLHFPKFQPLYRYLTRFLECRCKAPSKGLEQCILKDNKT